jgi:hypothetical protein
MSVRTFEKVKCRFSADCSFFQERMTNLPPLREVFKMDFCMGTPEFCARYMLYSATEKNLIPEDLLPYEIGRVKEVF